MTGAIGIITFLVTLGLSLVITRIATVALTRTGLSLQAARFQARSAFTGTGFTTPEAEKVVDHPVRRRIVMLLMITRSAGLVTIITSLMLSFVGTSADVNRLHRLGWIVLGVVMLWLLTVSPAVNRLLARMVDAALDRWTDLDTRDYAGLLQLSGEYAVSELQVDEDDWVAGRTLDDCELADEGVTVLGIFRSDGDYIGAPQGATEIESGDTLILYGRDAALEDLDIRDADAAGDRAHDRAVDEQRREVAEQEARDRRRQDESSA